LWAVVSASATGGGLIAAKAAMQTINPLSFNTYMFFIGAMIILVDAAVSGKLKQTLTVTGRQLLFLFIIAAIFCGSTFCLFTAVSLTEPATVSFLSRLELVTTVLFAVIFLKERFNPAEISGLLLVVAGIIVMRYGASVELSRAVALVSFAAVLFGAAEVLIKSQIRWINYRTFIFYRGIFMTLIFIAAGLISDSFIWVDDLGLWPILIAAGFFLPYLGRLGYINAMKYVNLSRASIIVQSQPFFAAVTALVILGTFPSLKETAGGILIVAGVILIKLLERRHHRPISGPQVS